MQLELLKTMNDYGHEQIVYVRDEKVGLRAIIAIHSTVLGPALGGTRFYNYANEDDALYDVLRLSRGMTLKNAAAGLKLGGGKAVILGDSKQLKSDEFFKSYGRFIESFGGKYYTAEDVNIDTKDVSMINQTTKYVTGTPEVSGDPSPFTARGVYRAMKAGASVQFGSDNLCGKTIVVQGVGNVGYNLCDLLHKEGAKLKVYDVNSHAVERAVKEFGAVAVTSEQVLQAECDIFAPCAMGAVLNVNNVSQLNCTMVAGAANNVLVDENAADALEDRNILYLPDYIVNAGGVINCGMEIVEGRYDLDEINNKVEAIYDTTLKIIELAKKDNISTYKAADKYALGIVAAAQN